MKANAYLIALQFLTRIPVKRELSYTPESVGMSVICFPIVGLLIGLVLYIISLMQPIWGSTLTAVEVTVGWIIVTGGLHLDGLGDMVDAWVGGQGNKEKTLHIMKDPFSGPMGSLALSSVLLLKIAALNV
jgi:adenosylcobinamide-GDP ribazoletransferase